MDHALSSKALDRKLSTTHHPSVFFFLLDDSPYPRNLLLLLLPQSRFYTSNSTKSVTIFIGALRLFSIHLSCFHLTFHVFINLETLPCHRFFCCLSSNSFLIFFTEDNNLTIKDLNLDLNYKGINEVERKPGILEDNWTMRTLYSYSS